MRGLAARRAILRAAAGAALLPLLHSRAAIAATGEAAGDTGHVIAPPSSDMIFRRTLLRHMPGNALVTTTRDFRVRFSALDQGGFVVDGHQVAARVDAPDNLTVLARLEEQRVERGVFPLRLDAAGVITGGPDVPADLHVALALVEVQRRFAERGAELTELLEAISATGARLISYLPRDLFAPVQPETEQSEAIALPWGQTGEVRMRFAATRDQSTGLMRLATRDVVTMLEGEERRSAERWELFATA